MSELKMEQERKGKTRKGGDCVLKKKTFKWQKKKCVE